jgi:hypothetical protein
MKEKNMSAVGFGKLMGWCHTKAWEVSHNGKDIRLSEAIEIYEKTKGKVKPKDIIEAYKEFWKYKE